MTDTVELFGIRFSRVTLDETLGRVADRIANRDPGYIVTPNVDHVCHYQHDAAFRAAYQGAFLVLADGMPLLWASRLLGKPLKEKVSGSDLVPILSAFAAPKGYRVFFFGAQEGVGVEAARRLTAANPGLHVAGTYSPPLGFEQDPGANAEALRRIRDAQPDLCFVALGSPRQETWIARHYRESGARIMIGVGAALDFAAGRLRRAPRWMQNTGLEWAWRLCQEPRRLWHRYLVEDMYFFVLVWREWRKGP